MSALHSSGPGGNGVRRVTILGSTGSVGRNTVDLLLRNPDGFAVEALTANRNPARLAEQARTLRARFAVIGDPVHYAELKEALAGSGIETASGAEALVEAAQRPCGDAAVEPALAVVAVVDSTLEDDVPVLIRVI